jgi:hypothetical protein
MPSTCQVKVNTVKHTSQIGKANQTLNYVEVTGYDATNSKGFKKRFFATKKDGTATVNAEIADGLNKDDWCEFLMDDTEWQNVQTIKKIAQPEGLTAPDQGGGGGSASSGSSGGGGGGGGSDKMSKEEWAAKDRKKEIGVARSVALKSAVLSCAADGAKVTKAKMEQIEKMADLFYNFLMGGDFNKKPADNIIHNVPDKIKPPADVPGDVDGEERPPVTAEDDIPF